MKSVTLENCLYKSVGILETAGIGTARLDVLVLLEDLIGKNRAWVLAHPEFKLTNSEQEKLNNWLSQRSTHIPLAFIRGKTDFYGREFIINQNVLEPRPESETMIDLVKKYIGDESTIADIGTGSGALAISIKLELPNSEVVATDIDSKCLIIAKQNAKKLLADIKFLRGNLFTPLQELNQKFNTVIANLPYVPIDFKVNQAAMMEPKIAIFGGQDGLDLYRQLFLQTKKLKYLPELIFTESLPFQHLELTNIAKKNGYIQIKEDDFIQVFKSGSEKLSP